MPNPLIAFTSGLLVLAVAPEAASPAPDWDSAVTALQEQQQRVTIHVPRVTVTSTTIIMRSAPRPPVVVEKKADDCVKVERISGFAVNASDSIDLLLTDGKVLRAKLGRACQALGFYSGFYVRANKDQKICAGRDTFRSRSGTACGVEMFRKLEISR
jgi:hypothetical protein